MSDDPNSLIKLNYVCLVCGERFVEGSVHMCGYQRPTFNQPTHVDMQTIIEILGRIEAVLNEIKGRL